MLDHQSFGIFFYVTNFKYFLMGISLKHSYDTQECWKNRPAREISKQSVHFAIGLLEKICLARFGASLEISENQWKINGNPSEINGNQWFLRTHQIWRGIFSQAKQARNEHFVLIFRAPVDFSNTLEYRKSASEKIPSKKTLNWWRGKI